MTQLLELAEKWEGEAAILRVFREDDEMADMLQRKSGELRAAIEQAAGELLNLTQAAKECGYSADHLGRLVRQGKLRNYGRANAPKVRRGDLPRKLLRESSAIHSVETPRRETVRAVVNL